MTIPIMDTMPPIVGARFELGTIVHTPGAAEVAERATPEFPNEVGKAIAMGAFFRALLEQHRTGDWGDLCEDDKQMNEDALAPGQEMRIMSAYDTPGGRIWIITEWNRSVTTILAPHEY